MPSAKPPSLEGPADGKEGSRIHWGKKRAAREPALQQLRPQPNAAEVKVEPKLPPEPPPEPKSPAPEALTKPDVDDLLSAGFELGKGNSGFAGRPGRGSSSREIQLSRARIEALIDAYEGLELEKGEDGEFDVERLKDGVLVTMADFKKKAGTRTTTLIGAVSELEGLAKRSEGLADGAKTPDAEVAELSVLIEELVRVAGGQKLVLKQKHAMSIDMMRDFTIHQLHDAKEDRKRRLELEMERELTEKKLERLAGEVDASAEREKKLQEQARTPALRPTPPPRPHAPAPRRSR